MGNQESGTDGPKAEKRPKREIRWLYKGQFYRSEIVARCQLCMALAIVEHTW